jgi:hypothetical protein
MPNGKPGDHPLTDIVVYNIKVFGVEIDTKVRQIHSIAPPEIRPHLAAILWAWPRRNTSITSPILEPDGLSYVLDALLSYVQALQRQI